MISGDRLCPVNAVAHLYGVEVDLHDSLFTPEEFNEEREVCLQSLSHPRSSRPEEHIFCSLLTDSACTSLSFMSFVVFNSLLNGIEVKAVM